MKNLIKYTLLAFILVFSISANTVGAAGMFSSAPDLKLNDKNHVITQIQTFLNTHGYIVNSIKGQDGSPGYEVDKFGPKTKQALIKFQKANKITPANGKFGPSTKAKMDELNVSKYIELSEFPSLNGGNVLGATTDNYSSGSGSYPLDVKVSTSTYGSGSVDLVATPPDGSPAVTSTANPPIKGRVSSGVKIKLTPIPNLHSRFSQWSMRPSSGTCPWISSNPCEFTMSATTSITAFFAMDADPKLTVSTSTGTSVGNLSWTWNNGNYFPEPNDLVPYEEDDFFYNQKVKLIANPRPGAVFAGWVFESSDPTIESQTTDAEGTSTIIIIMDKDVKVHAVFNTKQHKLTTSTTGLGSGTITSDPTGINCGGEENKDCSKDYDIDSMVYLTATPDADSSFDGWGGYCTNKTGICSVTMSSSTNVTANFGKKEFTLRINTHYLLGATGTVSGAYDGQKFGDDEEVYLRANPGADVGHIVWDSHVGVATNGNSGSGNTFNVTMSYDVVVDVYFYNKPLLTITNIGTGSGTVSGGVSGQRYDGQYLTLTATPDANSTFDGWNGDLGDVFGNLTTYPSTSSVTFWMSTAGQDRTIKPVFTLKPTYTLTTSVDPNGSGTGSFTAVPAGTASGGSYYKGDSVTVTANAAVGSHFAGFSGTCSGVTCNNQITITMSANKNITATFIKDVTDPPLPSDPSDPSDPGVLPPLDPQFPPTTSTTTANNQKYYSLNIRLNGSGQGSFTLSQPPSSEELGSEPNTFIKKYPEGTRVTVTPVVADNTSMFDGWSGSCIGKKGICSVILNGDRELIGTFTKVLTLGSKTVSIKVSIRGGSNAGTVSGLTGAAQSVEVGTDVVLTATANPGYTFKNFTNCPDAIGNTCPLNDVQKKATIGVVFAKIMPYTLTITPTLTGKVKLMGGIKGETPKLMSRTQKYSPGTEIVLIPKAEIGYRIVSIENCLMKESGECILKMDGNEIVKFTIEKIPTVKITFSLQNVARAKGTINYEASTGEKGTITKNTSVTFSQGTEVTLTPSPASNTTGTGERFLQWINCAPPIGKLLGDKCIFITSLNNTITGIFTK